MVSIYTVFPKELIEINDDYASPISLKMLNGLKIRVGFSSENSFLTCMGVCGNKPQSITNKQFFYGPEILGGVSGVHYSKELYDVYQSILQTPQEEIEEIKGPVFYCMDYESMHGTGHSYDFYFFLLYQYKKLQLTCPWLVPKTDKHYVNALYQLLKDYYNISFIQINYNKTYSCETTLCLRTYINTFMPCVKDFLNRTLIDPILEKYKERPRHSIVAKIKTQSKDKALRQSTIFQESELFREFCKKHQIFLLDESVTEEEKIYYLNHADTILVCWGSIFYIYVDYYLRDTNNKFISVLFHNGIMAERKFLTHHGYTILQSTMNSVNDNIYNSLQFKGEIVDNLETLDQYVEKTVLKDLEILQ